MMLKILKPTRKVSVIFLKSKAKTLTLMRCCSKCFSYRGNEKCCAFSEFNCIAVQGIKSSIYSIPWKQVQCNFFIAEVVCYHRDTISTFLNNVHGVTNNLHNKIAHLRIQFTLLLQGVGIDINIDNCIVLENCGKEPQYLRQ